MNRENPKMNNDINKIYKHIDKKFENMSQEELDEYDLNMQIKLANNTGKQIDARKRTGYKQGKRKLR